MARVALISHPACERHDPGAGHPDRVERLAALLAAARADPALAPLLAEHAAAPAAREDLVRVHSEDQVARVEEAARQAAAGGGRAWLDGDTAVSGGSFDAALAAAGCACTAAELVVAGAADAAFALSRPPGHHATRDASMGFCLFNNVAVAVRRLQRAGVRRVLVVDWDAHHGNGTQDVFDDDPDVYVLSLHLFPEYPGTGAAGERGVAAGQGTIHNVPLAPGTPAEEYRRRYLDALDQALSTFTPEVVFVSAGFDCLEGDPEGGFPLRPRDLHQLTTDLLERLPAATRGRVVGVLEGGYALDRIGAGLVDVLRALGGLPHA